MLDFKLMPKLKNIGSAKLCRPAAGQDDNWPDLAPVLSTKTVNRDLIRQQCDQIVKYTTALRPGTAGAGQVLRRFTCGGPKPAHMPGDRGTGPGQAATLPPRHGARLKGPAADAARYGRVRVLSSV